MKSDLLSTNEEWSAWTDWYDARLAGKRLWRKSIEIARASLPEELWKQGPAAVNAEIKRLIEAEKAKSRRSKAGDAPAAMPVEIPPAEPAAIEPTVRDGQIVLTASPVSAGIPAEDLGVALELLRDELVDLAELLGEVPNIDQRPAGLLRQVAQRIPAEPPTQLEFFKIGHLFEVVSSLSGTVQEEWDATLAARFAALVRHYERVVRQFPRWREFIRVAEADDLTQAQVEAAPPAAAAEFLAEQLADSALLDTENLPVVAPEVGAALRDMAALAGEEAAAEPSWPSNGSYLFQRSRLLALDTLESIGNVLKWLAEPMLRWLGGAGARVAGVGGAVKAALVPRARRFAERAVKSIDKELDKIAGAVGPGLWKWFKRLGVGGLAWKFGTPFLSALVTTYPTIFGWLGPLLKLIG